MKSQALIVFPGHCFYILHIMSLPNLSIDLLFPLYYPRPTYGISVAL
jgi:hypothetical protein